jgi:mannose-6-phosphate isomerase-like protein (cupin superfamily)
MEFVSLNQKIDEAGKDKIRNTHLFEAGNFRSWMLYFEPGDSTPMHYHQSPETFLVIEGKCTIKGLKGEERVIEKNDIVFFPAKDYYQLINMGTEPLILFGNRSEPFGVPIVRAGQQEFLEKPA